MKKGLCLLAMLASTMMLWAQKDIVDLKIEVRADYQREYMDGESIEENCGFRGKYLNMAISGNINDHFSYSWRQRFNKMIGPEGSSFFDATDWAWLAYNIKDFEISAGKQVVGIGGYEYDRAPIDLYFCSEFWNNVACYQFGVSGAYSFNEGKDKLMFQFCQSPFRNHESAWNPADKNGKVRNLDMYAYNLMWYGNHGIFSSIYSVNMMEYAPGRFINYISLGNKFTFNRVSLELDFMNRATSHQTFFFKDMSIIGELSWKPIDCLNVFGKVSYDVNNTDNNDYYVMPGTDMTRLGCGVEYFPLRNGRHDIRLHANYCHTFGKNGNTESVLGDNHSMFDLGVTWKFDVLKIAKK